MEQEQLHKKELAQIITKLKPYNVKYLLQVAKTCLREQEAK